MKQTEFTLQNSLGLQAKISCKFTTLASKFKSEIRIKKLNAETREADAKDIIEVLSLRIIKGDTIIITANGVDDEKSITELYSYLKNNCL